MTPLSEVAKDVAEALELEPERDQTEEAGMIVAWWGKDDDHVLYLHGRELILPYWRCACEDWLHEHKWATCSDPSSEARQVAFSMDSEVHVNCLWPEAPARLVSAVWRRMKEKI